MNDAGAMGLVERIGDLGAECEYLVERQRSARLLDSIRERLTLEVLHHDVVDAVLRADVVDGADVWMLERGNRVRFALKPRAHFGIGRRVAMEHFEGDGTMQASVRRAIH